MGHVKVTGSRQDVENMFTGALCTEKTARLTSLMFPEFGVLALHLALSVKVPGSGEPVRLIAATLGDDIPGGNPREGRGG